MSFMSDKANTAEQEKVMRWTLVHFTTLKWLVILKSLRFSTFMSFPSLHPFLCLHSSHPSTTFLLLSSFIPATSPTTPARPFLLLCPRSIPAGQAFYEGHVDLPNDMWTCVLFVEGADTSMCVCVSVCVSWNCWRVLCLMEVLTCLIVVGFSWTEVVPTAF